MKLRVKPQSWGFYNLTIIRQGQDHTIRRGDHILLPHDIRPGLYNLLGNAAREHRRVTHITLSPYAAASLLCLGLVKQSDILRTPDKHGMITFMLTIGGQRLLAHIQPQQFLYRVFVPIS